MLGFLMNTSTPKSRLTSTLLNLNIKGWEDKMGDLMVPGLLPGGQKHSPYYLGKTFITGGEYKNGGHIGARPPYEHKYSTPKARLTSTLGNLT